MQPIPITKKHLIVFLMYTFFLSGMENACLPPLPDDLFCNILFSFSFEELALAARVCKKWCAATEKIKDKLKQRATHSNVLTVLQESEKGEILSVLETNMLRSFVHNSNFCVPSDLTTIKYWYNVDGYHTGWYLNHEPLNKWFTEKSLELRAVMLLLKIGKFPEIQMIQQEVKRQVKLCKHVEKDPIKHRTLYDLFCLKYCITYDWQAHVEVPMLCEQP